ncbi:phosphonate degradation operons associated HDIG domain protein [Singulisphaera sp. GP187]|uniref:phosphonate degradation HD-domain oxygenase n=1 Tax=Singulisphaera sp. GP187 TaxID=1882752 RepID=UPI00092A5B92|nr:phosphonate degradation HD-domain oxygenase [Singulisphaera sp. GP187]SIO61636.1 phosphonate degradation operons associated HDIG domain protein [Singulisphaera sp. GP187]
MSQDGSPSAECTTEEVLRLFREHGDSRYGGEAITQREHALQAAMFAERENAPASLITAALLHDVGHLLHSLPDDAPEQGVDDRHEALAARWLERRFGRDVVEPVLMHVAAKRYLCATDPNYLTELSPPSVLSLGLQGGPMSPDEIHQFQAHLYYNAALALRRWDDKAKIPNLETPSLEHFVFYITQSIANFKSKKGS